MEWMNAYVVIGATGYGVMISDPSNNLWYMGQQGDPDGGIWKFNTATFQWAW